MCQLITINSGTFLAEVKRIQIPRLGQNHYILFEFNDEVSVWIRGQRVPVPAGALMIAHLKNDIMIERKDAKGGLCFFKSVTFKYSGCIPDAFLLLKEKYQDDLFQIDYIPALKTNLLKMIQFFQQNETINQENHMKRNISINYRPIFVNRYLRKKYMHQLSLNTLAEIIGCNPTYLSNSYSKIFNISPMKHLQEIRLQKAKELLINTDKMVSQIAFEVGYISVSQFIAYFKKHHSITPNEYRRRNILRHKVNQEMGSK